MPAETDVSSSIATPVIVANGGTGLASGTSGGIPGYTASGTIASSALLAANALVIGGGAGATPSTTTTGTGVLTALGTNTGTDGAFVVKGGALGTPASGNVGSCTAALPTGGTAGQALTKVDGTNYNVQWSTPAGSGTVTSVGQSFTGGLISVAGSPVTGAGTLALTVAGTSGGIPYFSSASTWATSGALTANSLVIGGGAGVAPSTTTTASGVLTFLGTPSSANLAAAVTDETGTGALTFATAPLFKTTINLNNPANTFKYVITPAAIAADRTLNLPLITATDTLATLGLAQTWTGVQTFTTPVLGAATATTINGLTMLDDGGINISASSGSITGGGQLAFGLSTLTFNSDTLNISSGSGTINCTLQDGTAAVRITATATLNFPSTAAGAKSDLTMTLTGAVAGEAVILGVPNGSVPANGAFFAWASASNTITVRYINNALLTAYDPASGTFTATIVR